MHYLELTILPGQPKIQASNRQAGGKKMCGRYVIFSLVPELERYFNAEPPAFDLVPNYNAAPTQKIPVIIHQDGTRQIERSHWGLVPFWAKDTTIGSRMINARVETLAAKPAFKAALKYRRCPIPANGFCEWAGKDGNRQPFYFHLQSGAPMAFAGLWEVRKPKDGEPYKSCSIITTEASDSVRDIHGRMPLILDPRAFGRWLDPENKDPASFENLLKIEYVKDLERYPVSKLINRVENNSAKCIERSGNG
jgi:putative SOS response-associated peptidase YedK